MIGNKLKKLRTQKGFTIVQLCEELQMNPNTYAKYERDERDVSTETLTLFADFYNVTTDYLLAREQKKEMIPIELSSSDEDIKIKVGQILSTLRKRKGYSQSKVAEYLKITPAAYQNYEAGRREANYTNICKLADLYNVTTDYLLARKIDPIELLPVEDWQKAILRLYIAMGAENRPEMIEAIKNITNSIGKKATEDEQTDE